MATSFSSIAMLLLVTSVSSFTEATNCGSGSYEGDSAYESHLNSVKAELKQGYTTGQRINPDVYGEAVCYVDQKVCIACVKRQLDKMAEDCPYYKGSSVSDDTCAVRYEPYFF